MDKIDKIISETLRKSIAKVIREDKIHTPSLCRLDESGIFRMLSHGKEGFVVVSANRSALKAEKEDIDLTDECLSSLAERGIEDTPKNERIWLSQRNNKCERELNKLINDSPFTYTKVYGGFHDTEGKEVDSYERSYVIYCKDNKGNLLNFDDLYNFGMELGRRFQQDSVFVNHPNGEVAYVDPRTENHDAKGVSKDNKINRDDEMFFTTSQRDKNGASRFTSELQWESKYKGMYSSLTERRRLYEKNGEIFV